MPKFIDDDKPRFSHDNTYRYLWKKADFWLKAGVIDQYEADFLHDVPNYEFLSDKQVGFARQLCDRLNDDGTQMALIDYQLRRESDAADAFHYKPKDNSFRTWNP